jgi:pimeloyl-ACP methyl ester carboxylesterase
LPASTTSTAPADPAPPYPVGVVHVTLVDPTRGVAARGPTPAASERTLPLTIRYPAAMGTASPVDIENAPPRRGPQLLVLFAHGLALQDQTYPRFLHDLAAAGFVVADPEFPLSSGALPGPARSDPVDQAGDLAFVADQLLDPTSRPALLRDVAFVDRLAVIGHSDGGITAAGFAANSCCADPRVGAVVVLAGALGRFSGSWFTTASPPLLVMHGTADETNPVSSSRGVYAASSGARRLVLVEGGSHIGAFEDDASRPAVVALVNDFLRASVSGDVAATARLDADSNVPGVLVPG